MSIRKSMVSNFILTMSNIVFPLITFPYTTRLLSNASLGQVFYVEAFTKYFILFSCIGIPAYGVREIAKNRNEPEVYSRIVMELVMIQGGLGLLFSLIFLCLPLWVPNLASLSDLIRLSCISIISSSFLIEWFYQGLEQYTYITTRTVLLKALSVASIILLVKSPNDYLLYYSIPVVISTINALINFSRYLKSYHYTPSEPLKPFRHFKPLFVLFSINLAVSVYTLLDTIILGILTDPVSVSLYNVPLRLVKIVWSITASLGIVFIPRIANFHKKGEQKEIARIMTQNFSLVLLFTIPFAFFCLVFPREILGFVSGNKYEHAATCVQILAPIPLIIGLCNVMGTQYLLPSGREQKILKATIFGLICSLLLNFLLIPVLKHEGAAAASLVAEVVVCTYIFSAARKFITISIDYNLLRLIATSLIFTFILTLVLKDFYRSNILLLVSGLIYIISIFVLQIMVFKNSFLAKLIKIPTRNEQSSLTDNF
ncbi:flippase [Desertivirga brevis]|uniref:flippase n=1 Tax=Desertivirga brevis TaxID=2810310 RepID=UPI001A961813|nr:flippase [Pedobacter sp. SYSU D00873]